MNITVFSLETEEVVGRDRIIKEALNELSTDKKRVQYFIFRLKHWKEIKKLKAAIDREFIYGTSDEKPKGLIKAAEEREMREKMKVFNWVKAARLIKEHKADYAEAGLVEDWEMTCEAILEDGKPITEDINGFLYSDWATPVLKIDDAFYNCYRYGEEPGGWTEEALAILEDKEDECGYCNGDGIVSFVYHPSLTDTGIQAPALYCPMCGRKIPKEEDLK